MPPLPAPSVTRVQHLSETLDPLTDAPITLNVEDAPYLDEQTQLPDVTTKPAANAVEDWLRVNTTADTHPIHLHLVTFEVIDRRPFSVDAYDPSTQVITSPSSAMSAATPWAVPPAVPIASTTGSTDCALHPWTTVAAPSAAES